MAEKPYNADFALGYLIGMITVKEPDDEFAWACLESLHGAMDERRRYAKAVSSAYNALQSPSPALDYVKQILFNGIEGDSDG